MATFEVTSPQGAVFHIDAPDGASEQDAINYAQQNSDSLHAMPVTPATAVTQTATPTTPQGATPPVDDSKPSPWADTALSAASNLAKGGVDAAMILPNLANQAVAGPQYLYKGIKDTIGGNPTDRNFKPYAPFYSSDDVTKDSWIDYKPQTIPGQLMSIPARIAGGMLTPSVIGKAGDAAFPGARTTADDFYNSSNAKYNAVEKSGATLDDSVFGDFAKNAQSVRPPGRIAQATGAKDEFDNALEEVQKMASVKDMTINDVKDVDQRLTTLAENARNGGASTPQSRLIQQLKYQWRSAVNDAADNGMVNVKDAAGNLVKDPAAVANWRGAVQDYATASRANDIELIIRRAQLSDNPATAVKQGFTSLANKIDAGKARGYTPEQIDAIRTAAKTGFTTGAAKMVGSRLGPIISFATGGAEAGVGGALVSKGARDFAARSQMAKANNVLDTIVGGRVQDPQVASWALRNQAAAAQAAPVNVAGQSLQDFYK